MPQIIVNTKSKFQKIYLFLKKDWERADEIDRAIQTERAKTIEKMGSMKIYRF